MRVRPVLVFLAGLAACGPTYQPAPSTQAAQWEARFRAEREARERAERENAERERAAREAREREEAARGWANFYNAHPILRGREKCVSRALNTLTDKTWDNLARTAISFCVAPPSPLEGNTAWVKVATNDTGHSTFVDKSRIEFRKASQATYWELIEIFDNEHDFFLDRSVLDCDKKLYALITATYVVAGKYDNPGDQPGLNWKNVLPNTVGEAVLNTVCGLRAAHVAKPAPPTRPVQRRRDFSKPEI